MMSIYTCTGYKHFGAEPPLSFHNRHGEQEFRDNMLYLSVAFSDWKHDREMLRFVLDTHFNGFSAKFMEKAIQPFVQANQTPLLHLLIWQHSRDTHDKLKLSIGTEVPVVERFGQEAVSAQRYIANRRAYYASEYARYEAEEKEDAQRWEQREQQLAERRRKREAKAGGTNSPKPAS
ncbi:hypothetical protein F0P96_20715 [Hymenobacter busanensis]|uniref:Uncharacterized protein n=1 Tax=Hymenobacter busanensis TaxID=2607656 RepID=A0AA88FF10_9BACT|nr:hypothetical protein [Hymenobacter busanensis]KAA9325122.1 hypothetical protein F0P96_20715 [Hymenobacter busanensis]